jgi:hypothetical protein
MSRRSVSLAITALLGAGALMIGTAGCGDSSTPAATPATTTAVETVTAAPAATTAPAPATTVTVDQNNDQNNNNQNNANTQNNDTSDESVAKQKAECLANNKGYPENCANIP